MTLREKTLTSLGVGRVFKDCSRKANSLDFTPDGKFLLVASDDDSLHLYDCEKGSKHKTLSAVKYGVDHAQFLHSGPVSAITSSRNDADFALRYWDLYENKYLRFFSGHTGPVTSLDVHPYEDLILSGSADRTALLWDLRKERPVARIPTKSPSFTAFDHQGLVFAVTSGQRLHLFDTRQFDKGEFAHFDVPVTSPISSVSFSPCGKYLLISTETGEVVSVDSFKGRLVAQYKTEASLVGATPVFSADSSFVACGSENGKINLWKSVSGDSIGALEGHTGFPRLVKFNPARVMVASACIATALWI